jgi:hypothetical protein
MLKASMEGDDVVADEQVFTGDAVDVDFIFGVSSTRSRLLSGQ